MTVSTADLHATRQALHAVAELVLAGPQHRVSGTIKLRVSPQGFRTWAEPELAVSGADLVVARGALPISGHSPRELADFAGVQVGAPDGIYADGSGAGPDDELHVDAAAAAQLADAYARGDAALRLLSPDSDRVLWPEHFDVAIRVDDVNFGVSPGDGYLPEPYAYVGVDRAPVDDPFWNAPFGAAVPMTSFADVTALYEFFLKGQRTR